jgi:toxin ParE1/3/4
VKNASWRVRLSARAAADFDAIVAWTEEQFGIKQSMSYEEILIAALQSLCGGPSILGAKPRDDLETGLLSLHISRRGKPARHFILFRASISSEPQTIDVLRILHDSMDLKRRQIEND